MKRNAAAWEIKPARTNFSNVFFNQLSVESWLKKAGFEFEEGWVREPNPEVEDATSRAYLFARKPGAH